jgi:phospholipid/cholesterol/gamma-HCH transport system ATP-binding protein
VSPPPKIAWQAVSKGFHGATVLDSVDLGVAAGRSLVIIGGSGQGKSVMLKVALGLMQPDAGAIRLDGEDVTRLRSAARLDLFSRFGMLFQGGALFDSLKVWENIAFRLLNVDGVSRIAARTRALEALESVHLAPDVADLYPAALSGGMQKRVGLARAVIARPEILFFDEPTTGLDPITAATINGLIVEQVRRLGSTAVSITHDLASARMIGDEIALLHAGRIVWRGTPSELDGADDLRVRQFVDGKAEGPLTDSGLRQGPVV